MRSIRLDCKGRILITKQGNLQNRFLGFGLEGDTQATEGSEDVEAHSLGELGETGIGIFTTEFGNLLSLNSPYSVLPIEYASQLPFGPGWVGGSHSNNIGGKVKFGNQEPMSFIEIKEIFDRGSLRGAMTKSPVIGAPIGVVGVRQLAPETNTGVNMKPVSYVYGVLSKHPSN